jgi:hypothetical protein
LRANIQVPDGDIPEILNTPQVPVHADGAKAKTRQAPPSCCRLRCSSSTTPRKYNSVVSPLIPAPDASLAVYLFKSRI